MPGPSIRLAGALVIVLVLVLSACSSSSSDASRPRDTASATTARAPNTSTPSTNPSTTTTRGTTTTTTVAPPPAPTSTATPAFVGTIAPVTAADLGATYHAGCPVGPAALRVLHLGYWGFDNRAHVGTMVVNAAVAAAVVRAFRQLFGARFPIRRMQPVSMFAGSDDASMAADNTSGFNCRYVQGTTTWSEHSSGEAVDVNTVENPYVTPGGVQPPAGGAYLDRMPLRAGMAGPGTALNNAFASIGWGWGGNFHSPDYQHFSANGR